MKYATGNRINFVQFESQFSYEMDKFLSEYAGINSSKYHKALSVILQIHMRAGNTGGYFLSAEEDDIIDDARKFNIGISELKTIYDVATRRGVFDREQYEKNHIITNESLQVAFCRAKEGRNGHSMDGSHILNSVYKKFKSEDKNKKIAVKLEEFIVKSKSIEPNSIESNRIESYSNEQHANTEVVDDDDMTLNEFKQKHPNKCLVLPDDWQKPQGVSLRKISEAIEKSTKFLQVKPYMHLEKLATDFYQKLCTGFYDDSNYNINEVKNQQSKSTQNYKNREYTPEQLNGLMDTDLNSVEL